VSLPLGCCPVGKEVNTILRGRVEKQFPPLKCNGTATNIRFNGKELCDVFTELYDVFTELCDVFTEQKDFYTDEIKS
jgi:hypothetical protein